MSDGTRASFKLKFFDAKKVQRAVDRATRKALSRFGAFVRRRARSLIRKRKKASEPGSPPSSHTGVLKKNIFFAYEAENQGVVIGPAALGKGDGKTPELLEHGGQRSVPKGTLIVVDEGTSRGDDGLFKSGKRMVESDGRKLKYEARPFMGPAFDAEKPRVDELWRNSVK